MIHGETWVSSKQAFTFDRALLDDFVGTKCWCWWNYIYDIIILYVHNSTSTTVPHVLQWGCWTLGWWILWWWQHWFWCQVWWCLECHGCLPILAERSSPLELHRRSKGLGPGVWLHSRAGWQANVLGISTLITLNESWSWIPWYFSVTSAFDILWWFCDFNAYCITKRGKTLPHFDASTFSLPRRACRVCVRRWKGHSMKLWQIGVMRHWAAGKA